MPSADILTERLVANGFQHLAETTKIVTLLSGKELLPSGVELGIELALAEYGKRMQQQPEIMGMMQIRKPDLFEMYCKIHRKR